VSSVFVKSLTLILSVSSILAWYFLGGSISFQEGLGMMIAAIGAALVQIKRKKASFS